MYMLVGLKYLENNLEDDGFLICTCKMDENGKWIVIIPSFADDTNKEDKPEQENEGNI